MIEQMAEVVSVKQGSVQLKAITQQQQCQGCSATNGCGVALLSRFFSNRLNKSNCLIGIESNESFLPGQRVLLGISEKRFLLSSALLYLLPVFLLLTFAFIAYYLDSVIGLGSEIFQILFTFSGIATAYVILRYFNQVAAQRISVNPVILRRL